MAWKNLKIGTKLSVGFGMMLLLIIVGGLVGYSGLQTVGHSLVVISDEEAPVVDASMEMKLALLQTMVAMEEYLGSTSVMATADEGALAEIAARYQTANLHFDSGVEAILNGGRMGDIDVIKTDNIELASRVREAAELHDEKYDATANELMEDGRKLLLSKAEEVAAMQALEAVVDEITADAEKVEVAISAEVQQRILSDNVGSAGQAILREEIPLVDMAMEMKYVIVKTRILMEEFAQAADVTEMEHLENEYHQLLAEFDQMAEAILNGGMVEGVKVYASKDRRLRQMVAELADNHGQFEAAANKMMTAHRNLLAQTAEVDETMERLDAAGEQAAGLLGQVEELAAAEMSVARENGTKSSASAIFWQLTVVGCSIAIGGLLGFIITRSLTRPINQGVALADEIAKGDFSQRMNLEQKDEIGKLAAALDGMADNLQQKAELAETIAGGNLDVSVVLASEKDQLGLALKNMTDSLNETLGQVQVAGEQIATGGGQVSDAAQTLSQGATESAASLEEITSSMGEMSSRTRHNAESSTQANLLSNEAKAAAEKGSKQMQAMVSAMAEINDAGQNISKIIKTIDEIAFQTNLLALNAAVEAARAGQHGKGFAVVAEEVRNLAARSAKAAEETAELIQGSVTKTENGSQIASQTSAALQEIVTGVGKVSDLLEEISVASSDQAEGISQVDEGLNQIDKVTQQNTASAEESAAAAEELSGQAEQLREMLQRFTLRDRPATTYSAAPRVHVPVSQVGWKELEEQRTPAVTAAFSTGPQITLGDSEFGRY